MPTENRSSNTEMVSAPFQREERYVVIKVSKMHPHPAFRAKHLSAIKREHEDALVDCVVVERDWPEYEQTWAAIEARVTGKPAPQPHAEPIAWLNTATGNVTTSSVVVMDWDDEKEHVQSLYTHADPAEVEQPSQIALSLQTKLKSVESERDRLRAKLAEQEHSARELLRIIGMSVQGSAAYNRAVIAFHDSLNSDTKPN
ncbi:hypothetical protein [Pseudomonas sp. FFUP_PS_473]|uniref:hypothetical protein n=1 Tax=Pseudomonas sp. FFUP_PS_473 TaxID=2060418 RepID=UPI0011AE779F|nr:hypothetical protein [Pseudomonas sp. FFUP_PS_473]